MLKIYLGIVFGLALPLVAIHILSINLVTDGLPALALGVEPAESDVMKRPPRAPNESLFARGLLSHIIWVGTLMATATLIMYAIKLQTESVVYARTMVFFTLALFQLFHVLAIRRERESAFKTKLSTNPFLSIAVLGTLALQVVITYIRPFADIFKIVPISLADLIMCTLISSSVFFAVELEKALRIRKGEQYIR